MAEAPNDTPRPIAEISQGPNAFEAFLDRNQKKIIAASILAVIATCGYIVWHHVQDSNEKDAGAELIAATDIAGLQAIAKNHPGAAAAGTASIALADKQWQEGQQQAAIDTLTKFVAENPKHPARPTAQTSLGSRLLFMGKTAEAQTVLQQVVDDPEARFIAPYALILLGDAAKSAGDLKKAESLFNQARTGYSGNLFAEKAVKHLDLLKAKLPAVIDPPPKPAKPKEATPDEDVPPVSLIPPAPGSPIAPAPPTGTDPSDMEDIDPALKIPPPPAAPAKPDPEKPADNGTPKTPPPPADAPH